MKKRLIISTIIFVIFSLVFSGFVMAKDWKDIDQGYYNQGNFEELTGTEITSFNESPILKERVESGELPPVEERLPDNPLVQTPWMEIGEYGGTLRWSDYVVNFDHFLRHINNSNIVETPTSGKYGPFTYLVGPAQPGILESWEMSDDGKVFTGTIRKGLKWSDGVPVTTDDVEYHIRDVLKNKEVTPVLPKWLNWRGDETMLEVVDKYTFRFIFTNSYGAFLEDQLRNWPASWAKIMRPKHYVKQYHKDYNTWDEILPMMEEEGYESKDDWGNFYIDMDAHGHDGGGYIGLLNAEDYPVLDPFIIVENLGDGNWLLERNPYYFMIDPEGNQLPYIDNCRRNYASEKEMINMDIVAGNTDIQGYQLEIADYPLFAENREEGNYSLMLLPAWQRHVLIYFFDLTYGDEKLREIIQDVRFRRAMSLALNREHIKESIFMGTGTASQAAPAEWSPFYEEGMADSYAEYDPEQAGQLLDEIGIVDRDGDGWRDLPDGDRFIVPLEYYEVTPVADPGAEVAKRYWEEIGVKTEVKKIDGALLGQRRGAGEVFACLWWMHGAGPNDPYWFGFILTAPEWRTWYETDGEEGMEPLPWAKEMLNAQEEVLSAPDREDRIAAGKKVWSLQTENLPIIGTVNYPKNPFVYSNDLGNISCAQERDYTNATVLERGATQWYFTNSERRE